MRSLIKNINSSPINKNRVYFLLKVSVCLILYLFLIIQARGGPLLQHGHSPVNPHLNKNINMEVPESYYALRDLLMKYRGTGCRLFVLPWTCWYVRYYWWAPFSEIANAIDIVFQFSPIPVISGGGYAAPRHIQIIIETLYEKNDLQEAIKLMGRFNTRYVLLHKDLLDWLPGQPNYSYKEKEKLLRKMFKSRPDLLSLVYEFPEFELYRLDESFVIPLVVIIPDIKHIQPDEKYEIAYQTVKHIKPKQKVINPTFYEVEFNSSSPFTLILVQNFSKGWRAYVNRKSVPAENHFLVNGHLNGWIIDEVGDLKIILQFQPQKFVLPSIFVSVFILICLIFSIKSNI